MSTTSAFRFALAAAALCSISHVASARPRRLVILDFDGPRGVADTGRTAVVNLLGEQYDVVATKRWEDARSAAQQKSHGPTTWQKAAKQSGVDAVIEGWIQDEGRHKMLTVAVREASTGNEIDSVTVRLGGKGLSDEGKTKLRTELEGVLEYIEGAPDPVGSNLRVIETRKMIGAKAPKSDDAAARRTADDETSAEPADDADARSTRKKAKKTKVRITETSDDDSDAAEPVAKKHKARTKAKDADDDSDAAEPKAKGKTKEEDADAAQEGDDEAKEPKAKAKEVAAAEPGSDTKDNGDLISLFGATSDEGKIVDPAASHKPVPTPIARVYGGMRYDSRSLTFSADNPGGPTPYAGVPHKSIGVAAEFYPFPRTKLDGDLSGIGFSVALSHSIGSTVSFDNGTDITDYVINQSSFDAGIHYRTPIGSLVSIDGHVDYSRNSYVISGADETVDVPDTEYSYLGAGASLDLNIADRATVGFGAKYLYMLDVGDISSDSFYGPGRASGYGLDASFVVPLPKQLFVKGALAYEHVTIEFDGTGQITEDEGVTEASDSMVGGSVNVGIQF